MMQLTLTLPCSQTWHALPARQPRKGRASWASWAAWCSRRGCRSRRPTRWGWLLAWAVADETYGYARRGLRLPVVARVAVCMWWLPTSDERNVSAGSITFTTIPSCVVASMRAPLMCVVIHPCVQLTGLAKLGMGIAGTIAQTVGSASAPQDIDALAGRPSPGHLCGWLVGIAPTAAASVSHVIKSLLFILCLLRPQTRLAASVAWPPAASRPPRQRCRSAPAAAQAARAAAPLVAASTPASERWPLGAGRVLGWSAGGCKCMRCALRPAASACGPAQHSTAQHSATQRTSAHPPLLCF